MLFSSSQWENTRETSRRWWAGELDRPLLVCEIGGRPPGRPPSRHPCHEFAAFYDLTVPAEEVVDAWDYSLAGLDYLGDGFPRMWPNFGPGVVAAFLGASLETQPDAGTVWFYPPEVKPVADLHFTYRADSIWLQRIKDLVRAAGERWQGAVQIGMTDLGGTLDILSTFRPGQDLLLDLIDEPDEVKRCLWELHELWFRYYHELQEVLATTNPGSSSWAGFFSPDPHYILQSDFSYMISPEMFDQFVKPELAAACKRLGNPFYHLDGPGQLSHLDSLLTIPELKGVQWIPGDGQPGMEQWPEVYRKIRAAGKLVQTYGGPGVLDALEKQLGTLDGFVHIGSGAPEDRAAWQELLGRYDM